MNIFRIQPAAAFLLLNVTLIVAMVITSVLFDHSQIPTGNIGAVIVILGWMTIFAVRFGGNSEFSSPNTSRIVLVAYFGAIAVHVFLVPLSFELSSGAQSVVQAIVLPFTAILGLGCPLIIMFLATRLLVFEEEGRAVSIDRRIGTFLAFFFLPIGIIFLQRRIRELVLGRSHALRSD